MTVQPSSTSTTAASTTGGLSAADSKKLKNACVEFEGQFFDMMLQEMRKTVPDDTLLGDDAHEQQIFQGMMDDKVSQEMAKHAGSTSLADLMFQQLTHTQGQSAAKGQAAQKAAQIPPHAQQISPVTIPVKPSDNSNDDRRK